MNIIEILEYIIPILIIYYCWQLNSKTKKMIYEWALNSNFKVISIKYTPWVCEIFCLAGGFHPANFLVILKSNKGVFTEYRIWSGVLFSNDKLHVRKIKKIKKVKGTRKGSIK